MCATHHGEGGETGTVWRRRRTPRKAEKIRCIYQKNNNGVRKRERERKTRLVYTYLYVTVDRKGKKVFYLSFLGDLYRSARERDFLSPISGVTRTFDVSPICIPRPTLCDLLTMPQCRQCTHPPIPVHAASTQKDICVTLYESLLHNIPPT